MAREPKAPLLADLKFDEASALAAFEASARQAINRATESIQGEHDRLVASVKASAQANGIDVPALKAAEKAVVIDFDLPQHEEARRVGLNLGHSYGWERSAELSTPLRGGEYRAIILITKRPG